MFDGGRAEACYPIIGDLIQQDGLFGEEPVHCEAVCPPHADQADWRTELPTHDAAVSEAKLRADFRAMSAAT